MIGRWPLRAIRASAVQEPQRAADHRRFHQLLMPHLDAAYTYARYLTRNPAVAEDIVQEAFTRAFRAIGQCKGSERAWLMAIVRNCFHDWARTRDDGRSDSDPTDAADHIDGVALAEGRIAAAELRRSIDMLPEPFRETLVLRELEQLSYQEIAATTGAPIGTVMSRLARARQMLSVLLLGGAEDSMPLANPQRGQVR